MSKHGTVASTRTDEDAVTLTILRTSDASKAEIPMSLHKCTVHDLKRAISASRLGPLAPSYQRLFHLGRELKSRGRSLSKVGIGRFQNYCLHLHSTQPETCDLLSSSEEEEDEVQVVQQQEQACNNHEAKQPAKKREVIDLMESDDEQQCEAGKRQRIS